MKLDPLESGNLDLVLVLLGLLKSLKLLLLVECLFLLNSQLSQIKVPYLLPILAMQLLVQFIGTLLGVRTPCLQRVDFLLEDPLLLAIFICLDALKSFSCFSL